MNTLILLTIVGTIWGLLLLVSNNVYGQTVNNSDSGFYLEGDVIIDEDENDPVIGVTSWCVVSDIIEEKGIYLCPCKSCEIQLF